MTQPTPQSPSGQPARPDVEHELRQLKDFQRRTVDRVHDRFWSEDDPTRRFLVADEVGLGKTLVARGVIARAIDHLWETVDRIDVVYICSNSQIARQNLPKLRIGGETERHHADRLTMLATELRHLEGRKLNFVSFTPGTSFNVSSSGGQAPERVILYHLLRTVWGGRTVTRGPWTRFFEGAAKKSFERLVKDFDREQIDAELGQEFAESLERRPGPDGGLLADELQACVHRFRRLQGNPDWRLSRQRYQLIGAMRRALAQASVRRLEPDLIILDEFQRFKDLMADEGEGADLARELFDHGDARLLLLSATPFKMYTLPDEPEGDDHYRDFVDTVRFLAGDERSLAVQQHLAALRAGLYAGDVAQATAARDRAQAELRRVMSRTERLATTADRDGFVVEKPLPATVLVADDVRDYARVSAVSRVVGGQEPLEYWRSAPFVIELMERYQLKQKLVDHPGDDPALTQALAGHRGSRLRWDDVRRYAAIDPSNAKMRGLVADVLDRGSWRLAWIPPSLPYYELGGPYAEPELRDFTKRLVFSAWAIAPKAIGTVLSYEAERRITEVASSRGTSTGRSRYDGGRPTGLLNFQQSDGRLTGMPVLGMLYPCVALAEAGDPVSVARELGSTYPVPWVEVDRTVRRRVRALVASLPDGGAGRERDPRWYWASGALLDRERGLDLMAELSYGFSYEEHDDHRRFADHLAAARRIDADQLGGRPDDLEDVLVGVAVGGVGNASLRALTRVHADTATASDRTLRDAASCMAWSLRNMFNKPELMGIVRGAGHERSYWQDVVQHCVGGGLQSVLDEYVYLLDQAVGHDHSAAHADSIARRFDEAVSLRTATQSFTDVSVADGRVKFETHRTRTHLAVRFGRGVAEDDTSVMREGQLREAFNSPFWPFVLASTSVGQEGLDFHHYSHAVVHWNLPSNPVDLEQREGRVHRYQGHVVRKNVASGFGGRSEVVAADNPWAAMFELATAERPAHLSDIYPSWIPPPTGTARIDRYVPALPLSRESHALRRLLRTVGAYRMVLGQPRQEDLLRYLGGRADELADLAIDLEPYGRPTPHDRWVVFRSVRLA